MAINWEKLAYESKVAVLANTNTFTKGQAIVGSTDMVQWSVKGNATQTSNIIEWRSSAALLAYFQNAGNFNLQGSATTDGIVLGSDVAAGGTWTSTNWTGSAVAGWTHTAGNTSALSSSFTATASSNYYVTVVKSGSTTGSATITVGGSIAPATIPGGNSTYYYGLYTSNTTGLVITPTSDFNGTIIVTVQKVNGRSTALFYGRTSDGTIRTEIRSQNVLGCTLMGINAGGLLAGSGTYNTAFGQDAMNGSITGTKNTAIGSQALLNLGVGYNNTAIGKDALYGVTSGNHNVGVGESTMRTVNTGSYNVVVGNSSLYGATGGDYNIAIGYLTLYQTGTATQNIGVGASALRVSTGGYNVGYGTNAGSKNTTGTYNTFIGTEAGHNASQKVDAVNSMALGYAAYTTADNQIIIGNTNILDTQLQGGVRITNRSDDINLRLIANSTKTTAMLWTLLADGTSITNVINNPPTSGTTPRITSFNYIQSAYLDFTVRGTGEANMIFVDADGNTNGTAYMGGNSITTAASFRKAGVFFPVQAPTASAPTYVLGGMYYDTTLNKLRIGGAAGWQTVTSV